MKAFKLTGYGKENGMYFEDTFADKKDASNHIKILDLVDTKIEEVEVEEWFFDV